ncbi:MAG TPA: thioredoxin [Aggregatilineales bacterium]|nr:thioredoxin [Aggregatilineales bacterium]
MSRFTFEVTSSNFQEQVLRSEVPVLVDFTADWCPPCKMLEPFIDAIAQKYQSVLNVGKLDTDAHPQIHDQFDVMGLPTLILFKNGLPVERIVGFAPRDRIEAQILPYLPTEKA